MTSFGPRSQYQSSSLPSLPLLPSLDSSSSSPSNDISMEEIEQAYNALPSNGDPTQSIISTSLVPDEVRDEKAYKQRLIKAQQWALDTSTLSKWNDNIPILRYEELADYPGGLEEILSLDRSGAVILIYMKTPEFGHWVMMNRGWKDPHTVEYFDSYGNPPDFYLGARNPFHKKRKPSFNFDEYVSGVQYFGSRYLTDLIVNSGMKLVWNKVQLQSLDPNVQTCGWWVTLRYNLLELPLPVFIKEVQSYFGSDKDKHLVDIIDTVRLLNLPM